ncbi:MAG TPA: EAL domain-containing protein [Candidatus Competibacteraceae bacterium]|nr:MAG: EAL domain-containing protein [Candidatus Competibacteraceae bacterium]HQC71601.1 EAL domain-containing protein [Candidatus Competibacteraceae bacterium]
MESKPTLPDSLAGKLQRIEDLAEKLVYLKWSREFFVLLLRATQDILTLARPHAACRRITVLAERLEQQVSTCLEQGTLPAGPDRERLIAVVDALCRAAATLDEAAPAPEAGTIRPTEALTRPLFSRWETGARLPANPVAEPVTQTIWLVAPDTQRDLARKIEQRGSFQVRQLASLNAVQDALGRRDPAPVALIIDLDDIASSPATLAQLDAARQHLTPQVPLLFLGDRGDITARLDAVKAGGAGYFLKPVDLPLLLDALDERVIRPLEQRVLIIDDSLPVARELARWLEGRGMVTQVLAQPLLILQALSNFQPSLVLLSLDLKEVDGLALAQALRQHERFRELPLILLSARSDPGPDLAMADLSGEVLLGRPPNPELLLAASARRLRQAHSLHGKLSQISHRDTVSGLYNRPYFLTQLERALVATAANAQPTAVMLVALDNLRTIENSDVAAADDLLEQAARRLRAILGEGPVAARFGDAVFTVLLGFDSQNTLLTVAHAVQNALEKPPYALSIGETALQTSIGISIASTAMSETATLIQQADLACSMARDSKDTRIHVHHGQRADLEADNPRQRHLLEEIREAVQQQRMNLLFQPIVSLRGDAAERYEVLLRMRNREGWELLPETVFTLVRRHRIGMVLDRWVIAHSIRLLRERQMHGRATILFINISPTILQDEELLDWLQSGLHKTGVPASSLVFELTESTAEVHRQALLPVLQRLKDMGCGLSLDRFSGHARSLALVQHLRANYVKLDGSFTQDLSKDKHRQQQLSDLSRQLATLGVTVIVTGIEDAITMPVLWSCGIDYVQGFFLQRPHTAMNYRFEQVDS